MLVKLWSSTVSRTYQSIARGGKGSRGIVICLSMVSLDEEPDLSAVSRHSVSVLHVDSSIPPVDVQMLPCCIQHNGPARIQTFFCPKAAGVDEDKREIKEAAFRGRKLLGASLDMPPSYQGFVLGLQGDLDVPPSHSHHLEGEGLEEEEEGSSRRAQVWTTQHSFKSLTYWNHETMPGGGDGAQGRAAGRGGGNARGAEATGGGGGCGTGGSFGKAEADVAVVEWPAGSGEELGPLVTLRIEAVKACRDAFG
eukprot:jgi/Mesen1/9892/ME000070S09172